MASFAEQGTPLIYKGETIAVRLPGSGKIHDYCRRCGGSGHFSFNRLDGTVCYGCNGTGLGQETTQADAERRADNRRKAAERRTRAEEKRLARQEEERKAWADQHLVLATDLHALVDLHDTDPGSVRDPLLSLAQQAEWRPLSDKQAELAERLVVEFHQRKAAAELRQEVQRAAGHLGEVDGKVEIDLQVTYVNYYKSDIPGRSGSYLVFGRTLDGHSIKLYSAGEFGRKAEKDKTFSIKATVKSHGVDNEGNPQTTLTRVKLA